MYKFTTLQRDALFHIANNCYGEAWEAALERMQIEHPEVTREQFGRLTGQVIAIVANMDSEGE